MTKRTRRTWASGVTLGLVMGAIFLNCGTDTPNITGVGAAPSSTATNAAMPAALRASYLAAKQKEGGAAYHYARGLSGGATAVNAAHQFQVDVSGGSVSLTRNGDDAWRVGLRWAGMGRDARMAEVLRPTGSAGVVENRATYPREDGSEESYVSGPLGVEQGFVIPAPPSGSRDEALALRIAVEGDLTPVLANGGSAIDLHDARGRAVARYSELLAFDAAGAELRSWLEVEDGAIRLRVDDASARYPLTIDPLVWSLQQEVTASDAAANDELGTSVSVSGNLAIIGAPSHLVGSKTGAGAAYVFVLNGTTWTLQQEMTAGDAAAGDSFGSSVAISGTVAVVGAPNHAVAGNAGAGAAYVFVQSGTIWTLQQQMTAGDAAAGDSFGSSVAIDGTTAVVGAPNHAVAGNAGAGAAYLFVQSGLSWTQQAELTAGDGAASDAFGTSVAVSGANAVVGAPFHTVGTSTGAGAAYAFVQSGVTWSQQAEMTATDGAASDQFGTAVSVSGPNALIGAPFHTAGGHSLAGAAYVFAQSGAAWTQQQELTASDAALGDLFGFSVAISGTNAIVGAYQHDVGTTESGGAAYVFFQTCPAWTQTTELTASDVAPSEFFGYSVSIGSVTAVVGAIQHDVAGKVNAGASYLYNGVQSGTATCCIGGVSFAAGVVNPVDACEVCTPASATTTWSGEPDGTVCSDGTACTKDDVCTAGICGGTSYTCTPTSCQASSACDGLGGCSIVNKPDGTSCATGEVCSAGSCVADCDIGGTLYPAGMVNPADACQVCTPSSSTTAWSNELDGTTCTGTNQCNRTYTCQAGACTGSTPVICTASDQCHVAGTCDPTSGNCSNPTAADGTTCSTGNKCVSAEVCATGVCGGGTAKTCTAEDTCHLAGTCNPTSGACSNPTAPDGTPCPGGTCSNGGCSVSPDMAQATSDMAQATSDMAQATGDMAQATGDMATTNDLATGAPSDASMQPTGGGDGGPGAPGSSTSGCGCAVGASAPSNARQLAVVVALALVGLALRRRRHTPRA